VSGEKGAGISLWQDAFRRLRRERLAMACLAVIGLYVLVALLALAGVAVNSLHADGVVGEGVKRFADSALFADYATEHQDLENLGPTPGHWFGTNIFGQDVLSRIANGARIAIVLGVAVATLAVLIGTVAGAAAGWFGKVVDEGIVWVYSTVSSIPDVMLMMGIAFMWPGGRGFTAMLIAMGCTYWVGVARIVRGEFLKLRERDYVLAARALGLDDARIMFFHVVPNVAHVMIVMFTLLFVEAIKAEVVLSFLGVGLLDQPSWGLLIQDAESELMHGQWWQITFTSVALFGIVLALQVFGDALRDALDPRLRH
jgi:ABC-type dipeptide/oligopeptide/nickel transport system permease subunit